MINVVGLGYIGLPTFLSLVSNGVEVVGTDCNADLINNLKNGKIVFREKGMDILFKKALDYNMKFSTQCISTDIYIVSVATPYKKIDRKIDTFYLESAIDNILSVCVQNSIIIIESTVSPNTINNSIKVFIERKGFKVGKDIYLAHAPERIIPGNMLYELEHNSRVIGVEEEEIGIKVKNIYQTFCKSNIIITDIKTAEMTKVVENTYRDINIAFANELTKICRLNDMDVYKIIQIANMHPRVNILQPGPGVGGHCIPVDPWFLVGDYPDLTNLILAARKVNDSMPEFVIKRIYDIMKETKINKITDLGFYGLTYKEDTDDLRESPSLQIIQSIKFHLGESIKTYDPLIDSDILENQYHNFDSFLNEIKMIVILVAHKEIIDNMNKIKGKIIFDTKNICNFKNTYKL